MITGGERTVAEPRHREPGGCVKRRGRVANPPYGTTGRGGRAQEDDTRKVQEDDTRMDQGEARFCGSTKPCVGVIL